MTDMGYMVRIEAQDADAIGEQVQAAPSPEERAKKSTQEQVWDQLKTCYDPEIPVNIVDLASCTPASSRRCPMEARGSRCASR